MRDFIHKTAIIEEGATIGRNVSIGAYCVVGAHVALGDNVTLKSHVVVEGRTVLGDGCTVFPFARLGSDPQDLTYAGEDTTLIIGKNNVMREYVTITPGTIQGPGQTDVGEGFWSTVTSQSYPEMVV